MGKPNVVSVSPDERGTLPIFAEYDEIANRIRDRAYQMFSERGFRSGRDMDDWLEAERLVCWPASELVEHDKDFTIDVALAGFEPDEISVTATPREIIVKAEHESTETADDDTAVTHFSEFRSSKAFRHFTLPAEVSAKDISAKYQNGMLKIEMPKVGVVKEAPARKRKPVAKKKTATKKTASKKTAKKAAKKKTAKKAKKK